MSAKISKYPVYKGSGIEWVGDIPSTWNVKPAFSVVDDKCVKNKDGLEKNVLSLSFGNIIKKDVEKNFGLLPESFNTYQIVNSGDIILRLTDLQNDKKSLRVGQSKQKGIITSAYLKLAMGDRLLSDYAYRLLHSYDTTKVFYNMGGGLRQSMNFVDFRRLEFLIPPVGEQKTIVEFLDYETGRIDGLVAKQEKLVELLKEKRQAVISHAVTKGLNPNAPMKDSGVSWLGQIPTHWSFAGLSLYLKLQSGNSITSDSIKTEGKYPVYGGNGLRGYTSSYNCNGIYALIGRQGALCGNVNTASGQFYASEHAIVVYPLCEFNVTYLSEMLRFLNLGQYSVAAAQPGLSVENLNLLKIVIPPLVEQKEIEEYLDIQTAKIDKTIELAEKGIELIKERRTALISAAVTGKIDVRGWQHPQQEKASVA
jgi:type I restriction enzyme S subunit